MPLAFLLIVFSIRLGTIPTWTPDILLAYPWIYPLTAPLPFLFGPFLWCSVRELVSDTPNLPRYFFLHLLPYFFEVAAVSYTVVTMDTGEYTHFIHNVFSGNPPLWLPIRNGFKVVFNLIYVFLSLRIAFGPKTDRLSYPKRLWLRSLAIIPLIVLFSFSYVAVNPSATARLAQGETTPFLILTVTMVVLIYTVSFLLMIIPVLSPQEKNGENIQKEKLCSEEECKKLVFLVEKRFSEGAYRNPDLMISDLAAQFKVHPNRLSYAINSCCNTSFRDLLNSRRLDYFLDRIQEGAHKGESILEIASIAFCETVDCTAIYIDWTISVITTVIIHSLFFRLVSLRDSGENTYLIEER
jgi:hypothetical protein